jgi:DNA-binding protein H-NS
VVETKPFDFSLFSDRQLLDLAYQVRMEVARRQQERRVLARSRGHLTEAGGPRYRNPANPAETWSGQGRPPAWVRRALAAGVTLDIFEVGDSD